MPHAEMNRSDAEEGQGSEIDELENESSSVLEVWKRCCFVPQSSPQSYRHSLNIDINTEHVI